MPVRTNDESTVTIGTVAPPMSPAKLCTKEPRTTVVRIHSRRRTS